MNKRFFLILLLSSCFSFFNAMASHIVGGEMTYKYLGDTIISTSPFITAYKYRVSLSIYEDCQNGQPEAIAQDNPAFLAVYRARMPYTYVRADSVAYTTSVPVPANFSNACVSKIPTVCLLKKTFVKDYVFTADSAGIPVDSDGFIIDYQRCCRNNAVMNILNPGNNG